VCGRPERISRMALPTRAQTASPSSRLRPFPTRARSSCERRSHGRFYLERGANGLTILGVMGEAPKLTEQESRAFISRAILRANVAPIIVGLSAPGLGRSRRSQRAPWIRALRASWSPRPAICGPTTRFPTISRASPRLWAKLRSPCRIIRSPRRCRFRPRSS
jgi:hypothetical protein